MMFPIYELDGPEASQRITQNYVSYLAAATLGSLYVWRKTGRRMPWIVLAIDGAIVMAAALVMDLANYQAPMILLLKPMILLLLLIWRSKIMLRRIRIFYAHKGWTVRKLL